MALGTVWLFSGAVFWALIKGPGTLSAWLIWGTLVFAIGWATVALPLLAIGDRIFRIPFLVYAIVGGLAGAFLMLAPNLLVRIVQPQVHWEPFSLRDLAWPGVAFSIASVATVLYRKILERWLRSCGQGQDAISSR